MTIWSAVISSAAPVPASIRSRLGPMKVARPRNAVVFGPLTRQSLPPSEIGSIRPKTRSRRSGQRTPLSVASMPYLAAWATVLALEAQRAGVYNIVGPNSEVSVEKARRELQWAEDRGLHRS